MTKKPLYNPVRILEKKRKLLQRARAFTFEWKIGLEWNARNGSVFFSNSLLSPLTEEQAIN